MLATVSTGADRGGGVAVAQDRKAGVGDGIDAVAAAPGGLDRGTERGLRGTVSDDAPEAGAARADENFGTELRSGIGAKSLAVAGGRGDRLSATAPDDDDDDDDGIASGLVSRDDKSVLDGGADGGTAERGDVVGKPDWLGGGCCRTVDGGTAWRLRGGGV
jgi:hypothetical protein